jgi:dTMP kinase
MKRGQFITLEGGEGAGKSTQAKKLAAYLKKQGLKVVLTREVGGTESAEALRKLWLSQDEGYWDPLSELYLIFAARREHLVKTIWPALEKGTWVVCDRFMDSTRAYQAKTGPIEELYQFIAGKFQPDLTLLLDMPVSVSMDRVRSRGGWNDRYQLKEQKFHERLRRAFLALGKKYPRRIKIIDAGQSAIDVSTDIQSVVVKQFKLKK